MDSTSWTRRDFRTPAPHSSLDSYTRANYRIREPII
uniref:Uncharacterized protein n=1 Tax=Anguilla anguilla TaxID=7936 RepID=A0A0E9W835_ANGAN